MKLLLIGLLVCLFAFISCSNAIEGSKENPKAGTEEDYNRFGAASAIFLSAWDSNGEAPITEEIDYVYNGVPVRIKGTKSTAPDPSDSSIMVDSMEFTLDGKTYSMTMRYTSAGIPDAVTLAQIEDVWYSFTKAQLESWMR